MTAPQIILPGTSHKQATSFAAKNLRKFEAEKLYKDQGIVWIAPTRGQVHTNVVVSWLSLQWPMNHVRTQLIVSEGLEVAAAYNALFDWSMNRKGLLKMFGKQYGNSIANAPFVLTTEEDNTLPPNTIPELIKAIYACPDCGGEVGGEAWKCPKGHRGFDAVSGLYFLKSDPPIPMAYGIPNGHRKNFDFRPVSIAKAVKKGSVIEVNGIAMGCALWRKALFAKVAKPWFKTTPQFSQDLWFCRKAKTEAKARFGVHAGLRVAHFNPMTKQFF